MEVQTGSVIVLRNIQSDPSKNGQTARIVAYRERHGRYLIRMLETPSIVHLVKRESFDVIAGERILQPGTLCKLTSLGVQKECNGEMCIVLTWNTLHARYKIKMIEDPSIMWFVKPSSLVPEDEQEIHAEPQPPRNGNKNDTMPDLNCRFKLRMKQKYQFTKRIRGSSYSIEIEQVRRGVLKIEITDPYYRIYKSLYDANDFIEKCALTEDTAIGQHNALVSKNNIIDFENLSSEIVDAYDYNKCVSSICKLLTFTNDKRDRRKMHIDLLHQTLPHIKTNRKVSRSPKRKIETKVSTKPLANDEDTLELEEAERPDDLKLTQTPTGILQLPVGLYYKSMKRMRGAMHNIDITIRDNEVVEFNVISNLFKKFSRLARQEEIYNVFDQDTKEKLTVQKDSISEVHENALKEQRLQLLESITQLLILDAKKDDYRKVFLTFKRVEKPAKRIRVKISSPKKVKKRKIIYVPSPSAQQRNKVDHSERGTTEMMEESTVLTVMNAAATQINAVARGFLDRLFLAQMELDIVLSHCATTIQAFVRGFRVRTVLFQEARRILSADSQKESYSNETIITSTQVDIEPVSPGSPQTSVNTTESNESALMEIEPASPVSSQRSAKMTSLVNAPEDNGIESKTGKEGESVQIEQATLCSAQTQTDNRKKRKKRDTNRRAEIVSKVQKKLAALNLTTPAKNTPYIRRMKSSLGISRKRRQYFRTSPVMKIIYDVLKRSHNDVLVPVLYGESEQKSKTPPPKNVSKSASPYNALPFASDMTRKAIIESAVSTYSKTAKSVIAQSLNTAAKVAGLIDTALENSPKVPGGHKEKALKKSNISPGFSFSRHVENEIDEITKKSSALPGPSRYQSDVSFVPKAGVGKISDANPKSDVDWKIYRAQKTPGPANYSLSTFGSDLKGGRFSTAYPLSMQDEVTKQGSKLPGPSDYQDISFKPSAGAGKISDAKPKSDVEWSIYRAKNVPGPGAYPMPDFSSFSRGSYIGKRYSNVMMEKPKSMIFNDAGPYDRVESMGKQISSENVTRSQFTFVRPMAKKNRKSLPLHLAIAKRMDRKKKAKEKATRSANAGSNRVELKSQHRHQLEERQMIMNFRGLTPPYLSTRDENEDASLRPTKRSESMFLS